MLITMLIGLLVISTNMIVAQIDVKPSEKKQIIAILPGTTVDPQFDEPIDENNVHTYHTALWYGLRDQLHQLNMSHRWATILFTKQACVALFFLIVFTDLVHGTLEDLSSW